MNEGVGSSRFQQNSASALVRSTRRTTGMAHALTHSQRSAHNREQRAAKEDINEERSRDGGSSGGSARAANARCGLVLRAAVCKRNMGGCLRVDSSTARVTTRSRALASPRPASPRVSPGRSALACIRTAWRGPVSSVGLGLGSGSTGTWKRWQVGARAGGEYQITHA